MSTVLEALVHAPRLEQRMVVGRTHPRGPAVKTMPDRSTMLSPVSHIASTPLWLVAVTPDRGKRTLRMRAWLRNTDGTLLKVGDDSGLYTVRGAEWAAYRALSRTFEAMRR